MLNFTKWITLYQLYEHEKLQVSLLKLCLLVNHLILICGFCMKENSTPFVFLLCIQTVSNRVFIHQTQQKISYNNKSVPNIHCNLKNLNLLTTIFFCAIRRLWMAYIDFTDTARTTITDPVRNNAIFFQQNPNK